MGTAEASMPARSVCPFFLSVCQSVSVPLHSLLQNRRMDQTWKIGSAANKAELQRAEAGGERRQKRIEARAGDIHLNLEGRWWGNVGHAYLRKHCWREGSIIAGSE